MENKELKWEDVPKGWTLCFNKDCEMREQCLRFKAGMLAPAGAFTSVAPSSQVDGKCSYFASTKKVTFARGFINIYEKVLSRDFTPMRKEMTEMLQGKRYYYEYMRGERPLSPLQQKNIRDLFARWGYADSVYFDEYEDAYDFKKNPLPCGF